MKKLLLFLGILGSLTVMGQAIKPVTDDTLSFNMKTYFATEVHETPLYIYNSSASTKSITWKIENISIPSGWQLVGFCDKENCYGSAVNTANYDLNAGDTTSHKPQIKTNCIPGTGTMWVNVQETGGLGSNFNCLYKFTGSCNVSVPTVTLESTVKVYPSQASDYVFIDYSGQEDAKVLIIDLLGNKVYQSQIDNNQKTTIQVGNFASGIYLVKVYDNNGNLMATKKIFKN